MQRLHKEHLIILPTTAGIPDTVATSTVLHNFVIIPVVLCMVYQIL